jgi:hypothetical protein
MRIGLFVTCLGDTLFPEAPRAAVTVLERLGHDVVFPRDQSCCGQLHRAPSPLAAWTQTRDLKPFAKETFREGGAVNEARDEILARTRAAIRECTPPDLSHVHIAGTSRGRPRTANAHRRNRGGGGLR